MADPAITAVREEARTGVGLCKAVTMGVTIVVGTPLMLVTNEVVKVERERPLDEVGDTVGVEEEDSGGGVVVEEVEWEEEETMEVSREEDEEGEEEERVSEVEVLVEVGVGVEVNEEEALLVVGVLVLVSEEVLRGEVVSEEDSVKGMESGKEEEGESDCLGWRNSIGRDDMHQKKKIGRAHV